jgi:hypothetical protein
MVVMIRKWRKIDSRRSPALILKSFFKAALLGYRKNRGCFTCGLLWEAGKHALLLVQVTIEPSADSSDDEIF